MILCMDEPWPEDTPVPNGVTILDQERMWISISSEVELTQGDALAMALACLTLQGPLERVAENFPDLDVNSFADDGRITGKATEVIKAYQMLKPLMNGMGLEIKVKDLSAWSLTQQPPEVINACSAANITLMAPTEGVMLLRSPLGSVNRMTQAVIDQWKEQGSRHNVYC